MARFRKDVLKTGEYSVLTEDGKGRRIAKFTPADLKQIHANAVGMLAVSEALAAPFCAEHQDDKVPRSKAQLMAEKVLDHLGYGDAVELSEDGNTLSYFLEVADEETAKKAAAIKYVSPEIQYDWKDGSGRVWPGPSISHIAATSKPVQFDQKPFQRLSLKSPKTVRLSLADRLGGNTVDKDDDGLSDALEDDGGEKTDNADDKGIGTPDVGGVSEYSIQDAMQGLKALGLHLPPGTNEANLIQHICVATHAIAGAKANEPADEVAPTPTEVAAASAQPKPAPGSPVMMSLEKRLESAEAEVARLEREDVVRRIKALRASGRIAKPHQDKLLAEAKTVRLSLDASTGKLASVPLLEKIRAYEELDEGNATTVRLGSGTPTPVPDPEEEAKKPDPHVMSRLTGGRYVAPSNGK